MENSGRDGSTRPPDLPLEKFVCLFLAGWVFLAARGLSLVVGSAGFSPAVVRGLLTAVAPLIARVLPRSLGSRGALI